MDIGKQAPRIVTAYVEMTPIDSMKYELDKGTGYIRVDRPQRGSALPPAQYGFIPRTYCGPRTAKLTDGKAERGDGDPLDICVLSERPIGRADIILDATVLGGLQMIDNGEADDKIIAVLKNDLVWGSCKEIVDLPKNLVERLTHYFSTYKLVAGSAPPATVPRVYGFDHAKQVIEAAQADYAEEFGG